MAYVVQQLVGQLYRARLARGISQRELSLLAGIPQAQISRIESGNVDLRLSSLAALAHALDLELALLPRKAMPAVRSLTREALPERQNQNVAVQREIQRISQALRHLQVNMPDLEGFDAIQKSLERFSRFSLPTTEPGPLRRIRQVLQKLQKPGLEAEATAQFQNAISDLQNALAHGAKERDPEESQRPAYALDGDDDG